MRDAVVPVEPGATSGERRHEPRQLGVHRPAVVALVVVLGDDLPVGRDVVRHGQPGDEGPEVVVRERARRAADAVGEGGRGRGRRVHEHEAAPDLDAQRVQRELRRLDVTVLGMRRAQQRAVEGVGPRVVGAADRLGSAQLRRAPGLRREELGATVPAHVVRRVQRAVGVRREHHGLPQHVDDRDPLRLRGGRGRRPGRRTSTRAAARVRARAPTPRGRRTARAAAPPAGSHVHLVGRPPRRSSLSRPATRPDGRSSDGPRDRRSRIGSAVPRQASATASASPDASAGQRGWNRQPDGMRVGSGISPRQDDRLEPFDLRDTDSSAWV